MLNNISNIYVMTSVFYIQMNKGEFALIWFIGWYKLQSMKPVEQLSC